MRFNSHQRSNVIITLVMIFFFLQHFNIIAQSNQKDGLFDSYQLPENANQRKDMDSGNLRVVKSDDSGLVFELHIPQFEVSKSSYQGGAFNIFTIPGYSQSCEQGKPQLPIKGFLFATPINTKPSLEVLDADYSILPNYNISPVPKLVFERDFLNEKRRHENLTSHYEYSLDQAVYASDTFYPSAIVKIGNSGFIRDQLVHQLQISPIQYNPVTKEIRWYKKIKLELSFDKNDTGSRSYIKPENTSKPFEKILRNSLLNYNAAKAWRKTPDASSTNLSKGNQQPLLSEGSWYKILVEQDGIYRLIKSELQNADLNLSNIDPRKIKIFSKGIEIPIYIHGQADGVFNDSDYIEFYGTRIKSDYTDTNVYWLTVTETDGLRMGAKDGNLSDSPPILNMSKENIHFEKEKYYETSIPNGEGEDHWFWNYIIAPNSLNFAINLKNVANISADDCVLKFEYRGFSHTQVNPDHHTILSLNDHQLADDRWDGQMKFLNQINIPQAYLSNGTNTISVNLPGDTGSNVDIIYINWFEVEYWRDYIAQDNILTFSGEGSGPHQFEVKGFTQNTVQLFDITDSNKVKRIVNFIVEPAGTTYTLKFQDYLYGKHRYLALTAEKVKKPEVIIKDESSQLRSTENQADYIIITHEDFYTSLIDLANFRKSQGLRVMLAKITDIYDEFNNGIKSPKAIKDFLSFAFYKWHRPAPTYVLLVGDATYDYKNYLGIGNNDLLPTHLFETTTYHTETSSDNWFVCVSGQDYLPDMLIGRLPARMVAEAEVYVNKIINYETNPASGDWNKKVLFVADNADQGGNFEALSDHLAADFLPSDVTASKVYLRDYGSADATRSAIINNINQGCLITNYLGHGSLDNWASEKIFNKEDVRSLQNGYKLPLVVTLSCLNGFFHHAENDYSLAEMFLRAREKGAVACLAPSGFGYTNADQIMAEALYQAIFRNENYILGSAIAESKLPLFAANKLYRDHIEFFNLFGDPALRMYIRPKLPVLPAGFAGSITIEGEPAPVGAEISAWIGGVNYPTNFIVKTPGQYGLMLVNGDDPTTSEIEGGAPGDTVLFKVTTANRDTFSLSPTAVWESGVNHHLDLVVEPTSVEVPAIITIDLFIDNKMVGEEILDGDPVSGSPIIAAIIAGSENGITKSSVNLKLNGQPVDESQYEYIPDERDALHKGKLIFQPQRLSDGEYEILIEASDILTISNKTTKSFSFTVNSSIKLENVINFPNPMQEHTIFTYYLHNDKPAEVTIKIYTVAGRLINVIEYAAGEVGYNETYWDGRDADGDVLANGVYLYKISADDGDEKTALIERLVIAR